MSRIARRPPASVFKIVTDRWTEPFWRAAGEQRLTAAQCGQCGRFRMPPTPFCPNCRSQEIAWPTLPGTGTVYAFTIVERAVLPSTEDSIPYVPAVIALDGAPGTRLITNIVQTPVEIIRIGAAVDVVFDPAGDGLGIPRFVIKDAAA